jgi:hypothetical protein
MDTVGIVREGRDVRPRIVDRFATRTGSCSNSVADIEVTCVRGGGALIKGLFIYASEKPF